MVNHKIGGRYAKSLLDLALTQNVVDAVQADVTTLKGLLHDSPDFAAFIQSPIIAFDRKKVILARLFEGKLNTITLKFLQLLVTKHREFYLAGILESFQVQYKELKQISSVRVISARPLGKETQEEIVRLASKASVGHANISLETTVDESLIGGFIIEMEDHVYDTSIRSKLARLRKSFAENLYESKIISR